MKVVISIYNPPELYPPTLYGVELLSEKAESITIVTRNLDCKPKNFPSNVKVIRVGEKMSTEQMMGAGQLKKIKAFTTFVRTLRRIVKAEQPHVWLAYDNIGLFSFYLIGKLHPLPKVLWYHNHDVSEPGSPPRKFSVTWWADRYEKAAFKKLDIFSLPAAERLQYFPVDNWKGKYFVVPNYPLRSYYSKQRNDHGPIDEIRFIYQGRISPDHGFEELIPLLGEKINGRSLYLTLVGNISDQYQQSLKKLAAENKVANRLNIMPPVAYEDLPAITAAHHIGLAIHKPSSIIYSTGGTASNKIYEYAASGLPVLLFDNNHYRKYLEKRRWAYFTDCTRQSLLLAIKNIHDSYGQSSNAAIQDFHTSLNYDTSFNEVMKEIDHKLSSR